ncbi:GT4 family glycosyltransferase PelF [Olsenella porci]|uniref:DUF3492 domain-containing protein n=1 Tax=Olsenella porci TaxID=2652279 RepID=A0A6N7XDV3_9ACTN|nr:GT4 family glycosyltransferase PelF [Olsenella porci]MST72493.1 DUF3492 domain-containing protein [Olsenella porci]
MRICMVAEGCYPYVVGGVSSWIHSMIKAFPQHEFVILAIVADRSYRHRFVYDLPDNVSGVYEVYLNDLDWYSKKRRGKPRLSKGERAALRSLIFNEDVDWDTVFDIFQHKDLSINDLLMGEFFLRCVVDYYDENYPEIVFSDFLWTMRSMYLPLFLALKSEVPQADLYHCVATGYAGVLGAMAQRKYHCGLLVSEHGIYTREREEELIKASWVQGVYKNIWIEQFYKMSQLAYDRADVVTSLYQGAHRLQIELGCPEEKAIVTPNGVDMSHFEDIPQKTEEDRQFVNVGAVIRVAPIKDVKTLIAAFSFARKQVLNLRLWIMGPYEEERKYADECFEMVRSMGLEDEVVFTGRVDVTRYLGRMDFTILTSISEGQPLTVLESFSAKRPVIATDVGCCRELLYGNDDGIGPAGILCHVMGVDEIADAMVTLAEHPQMRHDMAANGYERAKRFYRLDQMKETYRGLYDAFEQGEAR